MKKLFLLLACVPLVFASCEKEPDNNIDPEPVVPPADEYAIATRFEDETLRKFISEKFDTDKDGILSETERNGVTELELDGMGLISVKGIDAFVNLTSLKCSNNKLVALNVTAFKSLETLLCYENLLISLNVAENTKLKVLDCSNNSIVTFKYADATYENLTSFQHANNNISDCSFVEKMPNLERYNCANNGVSKLDGALLANAGRLNISYNNLKTFVVDAKCTELNAKSNSFTQLGSEGLDIAKATGLVTFDCSECKIATISQSATPAMTKLETFKCNDNLISSLTVSKSIVTFDCSRNSIQTLDLTGCNNLKSLKLLGNDCQSLTIAKSQVDNLVELDFAGNKAISIDFSNALKLEVLSFSQSKMESFDAAKYTELRDLNCANCSMTELKLDGCTKLESLVCSTNPLTTIDISTCTVINSINATNCSSLKTIYWKAKKPATITIDSGVQVVEKE